MSAALRSTIVTCAALSVANGVAVDYRGTIDASGMAVSYPASAAVVTWQAAWPPMTGGSWSVPQVTREFPVDVLLEPALQRLSVDTSILIEACWHGALWCLGLGLVNLAFTIHAKRQPDAFFAKKVAQGGAFDGHVHEYYVSIFGQGVILPIFWGIACATHTGTFKDWWYGAQLQPTATEFSAYFIGYFIQDLLAHPNSVLLAVHHVFAASASITACLATSWRGSFITVAMVFELGSVCLNMSDLGLMPRRLGHLVLMFNSILPMTWILVGFGLSRPSDAASWYCVAVALVSGIIRCIESFKGIKRVSLIAEDDAIEHEHEEDKGEQELGDQDLLTA